MKFGIYCHRKYFSYRASSFLQPLISTTTKRYLNKYADQRIHASSLTFAVCFLPNYTSSAAVRLFPFSPFRRPLLPVSIFQLSISFLRPNWTITANTSSTTVAKYSQKRKMVLLAVRYRI